MNKAPMLFAAASLALTAACSETPTEPGTTNPQAHMGTINCPLVALPASAHVVSCFTTTLQPGVWHGWILELSVAQPLPAINGAHTRTRLNHPYMLALPTGYRKLNDTELGTVSESIHAFQSEFNGFTWFDVLRLQTAASGPPQTVPVVAFWVEATAVGRDLTNAVSALRDAGIVNGGQANALTKKLAHAGDLITSNKVDEAVEVLEGFIQHVRDLTYTDLVLPPEDGERLIAWAEYMIEFI